MKKFLSLVLALVMTMSLVTVSAGAKDFTDDSKITYDEAVAVMSEVKVIDGYTDGSFQPTTDLTRGAAAKIICNLILGPTTAAALGADTAPYSDVPVNHTFAGYIAYCQKTGIISGYADGTFKPAAPLTGYAFMKMLLGALGYNSDVEGYTGANWSINVAKQAIAIGLAKGNDDFTGQAYVNREEACLYSLNTLKATMVEYPQTTTVNVNGADVVLASARTEVSWGTAKANDGHIKTDGYVQFAEKYFPNLELEVGHGIYGRPANTWKNKKSEIGTFTSIDPTYVYTESMEEGDVYKDLGKALVDEYEWTVYVNGVEQSAKNTVLPSKSSTDEYVYTGEGTVTEIYVNDDEETVDVVEYNYYLGQVSKVKSDDDGEYITVSVISKGAKNLDNKTFYVDGYAEDDYVVFTMDWDDDEDEYVIGEVFEPETATGTVTRVEKDTNTSNGKVTGETYLKMDGDKYIYTEDVTDPAQQQHMVYDLSENTNVKAHPTLEKDYILYLDPNGYVLGFEPAEDVVDQYLFVKDADEEMEDWRGKVYLPDGTTATVDVDNDLTGAPAKAIRSQYNNQRINFANTGNSVEWINSDGNVTTTKLNTNIEGLIWKYSAGSDGVYDLTYVTYQKSADASDETQWLLNNAQIKNGKAYVTDGNNTFIVDKKTVFVDVQNETTYTGYTEVPNVDNAQVAYVLDGKIAEVVFIIDGDIYDEASIYFMLADDDRESLKYDDDNYWMYSEAYVNGEKTTLTIAYNADKSNPNTILETAPTLYKVKKTVNEDYITEVEKVANAEPNRILPVEAVGVDAFWVQNSNNTGVDTYKNKFDTNDETVFVVVEQDEDGKYRIFDGDIGDILDKTDLADPDCDYSYCRVQVVKQDEQTAELVYVYLIEKGASGGSNKPDQKNLLDSVKVNGYNVTIAGAYKNMEDAIENATEVKMADSAITTYNFAVTTKPVDTNGDVVTSGGINAYSSYNVYLDKGAALAGSLPTATAGGASSISVTTATEGQYVVICTENHGTVTYYAYTLVK